MIIRFRLHKIQYRFLLQVLLFLITGALLGGILYATRMALSSYTSFDSEFRYINKLVEKSYAEYTGFRAVAEDDPDFFNSDQNRNTLAFSSNVAQFRDTLNGLYSIPYLKRRADIQNLRDTVNDAIEMYQSVFGNYILAIKERGIYDHGSLAQFRSLSGQLLSPLSPAIDPDLYSKVMELKELETAYLYNNKISAYYSILEILEWIGYYSFPEDDDTDLSADIGAAVNKYTTQLNRIEKTFQRIGSAGRQSGLIFEMDLAYQNLTSTISRLTGSIQKASRTLRTVVISSGIFLGILIVALYILILIRFGMKVSAPLNELIDFTFNLSKGKLQQEILTENMPYEFGQLEANLNNLRKSLIEKREFVDDLLKQKFLADISLQGKHDMFGKTLLALKENMRKTRDEQLKYAQENDHRQYLNEGLAKFADILRSTGNDMTLLGDKFIRELVKYLDAIQGGLFMISEEDPEIMNLVATFAYNRKKYIKRSIGIGEGLVGACALERKSIHLTEIPDDYIEITSGLGDSPPRNLLLLPVLHEETLIGVVEIASLRKFDDVQIELGESIASSLAATIIATQVNTKTSELLAKSQQQAAEMAEQEEEMRQNMEELKATQEESQRREEELEGILSAIDQSFYVLEYDKDGLVIKVNQKLLFLLNQHADNIIGKSHQEIFGKGTKVDSLLFANISEGNSVELIEKVTINKKPTVLKNTFSPIRSKTGETHRILNIMTINY
jgi:HAMP domain-containing protein